MLQIFFIKLIGLIASLFNSLSFNRTREKLLDEDIKHDFLDTIFNVLVDERKLFDVYGWNDKVDRIDIRWPKDRNGKWKVNMVIRNGSVYKSVEIYSVSDKDFIFELREENFTLSVLL